MILIGIDPGNDGGVAFTINGNPFELKVVKGGLPDATCSRETIEAFSCTGEKTFCAIEENTVDPKKHKHAAVYYRNQGRAEQWCLDCGIDWEPVPARKWQGQLLKGVVVTKRLPVSQKTKEREYNYLLIVIGETRMRELGIITPRGAYKDGLGDALCIALWLKAKKEAGR